jgi:uncharacterized membrane protein
MKSYVTVGLSVLAGAALFEAALIPGMLIGGAVVLAPKYLPNLRRGLRPLFGTTVRRRNAPKRPRAQRQELAAPPAAPARFGIKQAIAKTITFRIIVTTLDFTTNYIVIGELATAAGLSTFNLVVGPVFYLVHETAWNYFGPAGADVRVPVGTAPLGRRGRVYGQSGVGQDHHVSHPRHGDGLHHELRGGRRRSHGGGSVSLRLRGRPLRLSRPREALGLLWLAESAHSRSADGDKPIASACVTPIARERSPGSRRQRHQAGQLQAQRGRPVLKMEMPR